MTEFFRQNSEWLSTAYHFRTKAPSWVLNTSLPFRDCIWKCASISIFSGEFFEINLTNWFCNKVVSRMIELDTCTEELIQVNFVHGSHTFLIEKGYRCWFGLFSILSINFITKWFLNDFTTKFNSAYNYLFKVNTKDKNEIT